jgi:hypothetical protein
MTKLRAGDWVEVRSKAEILRTLDERGRLDGLPFMPEMFAFCGRRFQVYKRAHKTCDTVFPTRGRRVADAVHLDTRCSGEGHGGCQAGCLLFWKVAWLKRVDEPIHQDRGLPGSPETEDKDERVWVGTLKPEQPADGPVYSCQATELPYFTTELKWWHVTQYVEDYTSGNVDVRELLRGAIYSAYYNLSQAGIGLGPPMRWLWNRLRFLWGGTLFPRTDGAIATGQPTPQRTLALKEGEIVRVRPHEEILCTVNKEGKNRGMYWDAEMVPYCGGTYPVRQRVGKLIDEKTGKMLTLKNEAIILEGVFCQGKYSGHRMFCPRALYPYWREAWLERVTPAESTGPTGRASSH